MGMISFSAEIDRAAAATWPASALRNPQRSTVEVALPARVG
ncbi:hypothetical protein [Saccharopolyspora sp. NPDC002376]